MAVIHDIEIMVILDGRGEAYVAPMTYRGAPLDGAEESLIATSQHSVLGRRWIYDGEGDPVFQARLAALLRGDVLAQAQTVSDTVDPTVQVQPSADISDVRVARVLRDGNVPPPGRASVSATWKRADGTVARRTIASAS